MPLDAAQMEAAKRLVTEPHFRLLREFGRNTFQQKLSDREREMMWQLSCRQGGVAVLPQEVVVEAWKEYVGGVSKRSNLAINGDIDPELVTVGVTYDELLTASHTSPMRPLLGRLLQIWRKAFASDEEFLEAAERLVRKSVGLGRQPRKPRKEQG